MDTTDKNIFNNEVKEKVIKGKNGIPYLISFLLMMVLSIALFGSSIAKLDAYSELSEVGEVVPAAGYILMIGLLLIGILLFITTFILFFGLKTVKPNEALVLTLFGEYYGTLREAGFFWVHPFSSAFNPAAKTKLGQSGDVKSTSTTVKVNADESSAELEVGLDKAISLKAMTLNNARQKVNDCLGNPVEIGIAVIWRVVDTAKAVFNVDNFKEYLSLQADAGLREIVRNYPYDKTPGIDTTGDGQPDEGSLRGSAAVVAERIKNVIQEKVEIAGLEIIEARITYLAYAPEIAATMLQRQQASAVVDARTMIVEGAVGMVEMALDKLNENNIVELDEERKAAMVSNLLVVLCSNKDANPVVNSGSLY